MSSMILPVLVVDMAAALLNGVIGIGGSLLYFRSVESCSNATLSRSEFKEIFKSTVHKASPDGSSVILMVVSRISEGEISWPIEPTQKTDNKMINIENHLIIDIFIMGYWFK